MQTRPSFIKVGGWRRQNSVSSLSALSRSPSPSSRSSWGTPSRTSPCPSLYNFKLQQPLKKETGKVMSGRQNAEKYEIRYIQIHFDLDIYGCRCTKMYPTIPIQLFSFIFNWCPIQSFLMHFYVVLLKVSLRRIGQDN